jgi:signal transduction histidine kinase
MINLVANAIKFSPEHGPISITSKVDDSGLIVSVKDQGIGISKQDQEHLFERFFRAENATNVQGTGLGLNIVLKYLELMSGHINCDSELGKGTTFTFRIPKHRES